jgi:hypothetical protein
VRGVHFPCSLSRTVNQRRGHSHSKPSFSSGGGFIPISSPEAGAYIAIRSGESHIGQCSRRTATTTLRLGTPRSGVAGLDGMSRDRLQTWLAPARLRFSMHPRPGLRSDAADPTDAAVAASAKARPRKSPPPGLLPTTSPSLRPRGRSARNHMGVCQGNREPTALGRTLNLGLRHGESNHCEASLMPAAFFECRARDSPWGSAPPSAIRAGQESPRWG